MRPRFAEAKSRGGFFGGEFRGGFDDRTERVTHHAGIFTIGMVDAPQLVGRFRGHGRVHGGS